MLVVFLGPWPLCFVRVSGKLLVSFVIVFNIIVRSDFLTALVFNITVRSDFLTALVFNITVRSDFAQSHTISIIASVNAKLSGQYKPNHFNKTMPNLFLITNFQGW